MSTSQRASIPSFVAEWYPALIGFVLLFVPTYVDLARTLWATDEQGHGPIILAVILWYFWSGRKTIDALPARTAALGWPVFILGLLLYVVGRSQDILIFETGAQILVVTGILLIQRGWAAIRVLWFPILFLIFLLPLPSTIVDALTLPMKIGVSWATEQVLYWANYPISRSGVMLQIGPYKLLVADACAGLHTLFTLEALSLLYLHIMRHDSVVRNVLLAIMIVPISFTANTTRVICLTLITYYFGDAAGQGFLHGFAGMVLFLTALILIISIDAIIQYGVEHWGSRARPPKTQACPQ